MSTAEILLLGVIAGGTIFLGLPIGRLRNIGSGTRAGLSAFATGILVFLLWDVLSGAVEPIESALDDRNWDDFAGFAALGLAGFIVGYMSLVYYTEWMKKKGRDRPSPLVGPGAAAIDEFDDRSPLERLTPGGRLAVLIAVGIGVHNFGEGLAIGQAAANELTALAVTLVIGFALHNATEGFGIVGPMAGEGTVPSWRFLALLGLIGGGPTFVGTLIGQAWTSREVSVLFFAIAGGSILYVVQELFAVNRRYGHTVIVAWLVLAGIVAGFATDFIIAASGL